MLVTRRVARAFAPFALALSLVGSVAVPAHAAGFTVMHDFVTPTASVSGVSLTMHTWFDGTGPVTLTVGTGPNVAATAVKSATTSTHFSSSWSLTVKGLQAHSTYYYMLTAHDGRRFTSTKAMHTPIRDVKVSFKRLHVIHDGDGWPKGCGDFHFTFDVNDYDKYTSPMCLNDGDNVPVPHYASGWEPGEFSEKDFTSNSILVEFWAQDDDHCRCLAESEDCDHYDWKDVACADLAYDIHSENVTHAGTTHHYWEVEGYGVDVITDYTLKVSYHW